MLHEILHRLFNEPVDASAAVAPATRAEVFAAAFERNLAATMHDELTRLAGYLRGVQPPDGSPEQMTRAWVREELAQAIEAKQVEVAKRMLPTPPQAVQDAPKPPDEPPSPPPADPVPATAASEAVPLPAPLPDSQPIPAPQAAPLAIPDAPPASITSRAQHQGVPAGGVWNMIAKIANSLPDPGPAAAAGI